MVHHDRHDEAAERQGAASDRGGRAALVHLDDLDDYKVADGEPDIRGWTVKSADGHDLGKVEDLLVDTGAMTVRYLDVELDKKVRKDTDNRHVLVPIATAQLDDDNDDVLLRVRASEVAGVPAYTRDTWSNDDEQALLGHYGGGSPGASAMDNANDRHTETERFFGSRRRGRGDSAYLTRSEKELAVGKRPEQKGTVEDANQ